MNEVFRISTGTLRHRRWRMTAVPFMVAAIGAVQVRKDSLVNVAAVMTLLLGIAIIVAYRQYKGFAMFAATHSLELRDDMMVLRDGDVETRIPYHAVRRLRVVRSIQAPRQATLSLEDGSKTTLVGYRDMQLLVEGIARHLGAERVDMGPWFQF